jgi:hypothetical protein
LPPACAGFLLSLLFKPEDGCDIYSSEPSRFLRTGSACRLLLLVSCLAYSSTLKMEAIYSSETSGCLLSTSHNNPEDHALNN